MAIAPQKTDPKPEALGLGKNRVEALTDGVFAIAMTLMIFNIRVPSGPSAQMPHRLLALWPSFMSYAVSFIVLGIYWVGHHNHFHFVRRTDRVSIWINLSFLLAVTLIPFSTALLGEYPDQQVAVVLYGINLICVGLLLYAHFWYTNKKGQLVEKTMDSHVVALAERRILTGPLVCLLPIALSFYRPRLAALLYGLVPVLYILPGEIDRHLARSRRHASAPPNAQSGSGQSAGS
jgi:uncharacterized membrane protein